jgi:DNA-binding NarL/FixJ family response regulator
MSEDPIKIVIADDHDLIRDGLKMLLSSNPQYQVVGEVASAAEVVPSVARHLPHILILDLYLNGSPHTQLVAEVKSAFPAVKVLVLTGDAASKLAHESLQNGADGYFLKGGNGREIQRAIPLIMAGEQYVCEEMRRTMVTFPTVDANAETADGLTVRELEMLKLVAEGMSSQEIAARLQLSPNTVRKHRQNLMDKLGLHKATELTAYAIHHGLIS